MPKKVSKDWVRIQVPVPPKIKNSLEKKAATYGFDSLQAYLRFVLKAAVENRHFDLNADAVPSYHVFKRWVARQLMYEHMREQETDRRNRLVEFHEQFGTDDYDFE